MAWVTARLAARSVQDAGAVSVNRGRDQLQAVDHRFFAFMNKLYGILHGQNVLFSGLVRLMNNGGKGSRFPASCGSCDQNQAPRQGRQSGDHRGETQFFTRHDL